MAEQYSGSLFIVAAPSGGGKTSLVKKLIDELNDIEVSISHTTRPQRPGETHGVDYFFIDQNTFNEMIREQEFVEHAHVFEHSYGTSKAQIHDRLQAGIDVVLDIDWQGAKQIKHIFKDAVGIFIVPPSLEALKQRLFDRKQDNQEVIAARMNKAKDELSHYHEFDYLIVNDQFKKAAEELKSIVIAHRLRLKRQSVQQRKLLSLLLTSQ
ncbi:guanylate kinase [Legionella impletisoli]|uniref:Guanylate kinase n=1 Tax=Legionella impletisoli TaxID=343510 RepID=A0A917NBH9_9GAMM|nr:guanylate kinase [Legionella impletisoli]GGI85848.1 guanylate kinase [Legionella impletisoli]